MDLPESAQVGLESLADFERFHSQAMVYLLAQLSVFDANFKMTRRANIIPHLDLHHSVHDTAYQLPRNPSGHALFGGGLHKVLSINEEICSKIFTQTLEKATLQSLRQAGRQNSRPSLAASSQSSSMRRGGGRGSSKKAQEPFQPNQGRCQGSRVQASSQIFKEG